jgi:hypothetical protein
MMADTNLLKQEYDRGVKDARDEAIVLHSQVTITLEEAIAGCGYLFSNTDVRPSSDKAASVMSLLKRDLDAAESRCRALAERVVALEAKMEAAASAPASQVSRHHIFPQLQRLLAVPLVAFSNERGRETCLAAARNDFAGEILSALEAVLPTVGQSVRVLIDSDRGKWVEAHVTGHMTFRVQLDQSKHNLDLKLHEEGTDWRRDQPSVLEKPLIFTVNGRCHAGSDGDCDWPGCPQTRDGEPAKSGRTCPLWAEHHEE